MGIVHRDLNSKNCLLRKVVGPGRMRLSSLYTFVSPQNMTALVADFGLARVLRPIDRQDSDGGGRAYEKKRCVWCALFGIRNTSLLGGTTAG